MYDRWKETFLPKTSLIRPVFSIQYWRVTEGGQTKDASLYRASIESCGKTVLVFQMVRSLKADGGEPERFKTSREVKTLLSNLNRRLGLPPGSQLSYSQSDFSQKLVHKRMS